MSFAGISFEPLGYATEGSKVTVFASVSDDGLSRGIKANDWINAVLTAFNGRGGGKPNSAQGSALLTVEQSVTARDKVSALATQYLTSKAAPVK